MRAFSAAVAIVAAMSGSIAHSKDAAERKMEALLRSQGMFGVVTAGMSEPQQVVLCGKVAESYLSQASGTADPAQRDSRVALAWQLSRRLEAPLAKARAQLDTGLAAAEEKAGQAMTLLSMAPDAETAAAASAGEDVLLAFLKSVGAKCHARLDAWGAPRVSGPPPAAFLADLARFRFRGSTYAETFAGTGLAKYAADMCQGAPAPDFAGAPLKERGKEGMSLLDWAMECGDMPAFEALLAAGADVDALGLWEEPPVYRAATEKRLPYLQRLLDKGAKADAIGHSETALDNATKDYDAINSGGNTQAAFDLLRARGATLDFPDFAHSMWTRWALHENRWDKIRDHWQEFHSDPVALAQIAEMYLNRELAWAKEDQRPAIEAVKARLIADFGVCFPVAGTIAKEKDSRGFLVQSGCARK